MSLLTMTTRFGRALLAGALLATAAVHAAEPNAGMPPGQLIESAAQAMLKDLEANRAEYRKDPSKIQPLVEKYLLPYFDTEYAAQLVLGRHWRTATPEQRERFVKAFYQSLLRNYGDALVEFTADRLRVLPANVEPNADRATVRTEIRRSDGSRVPVNYSMRKTPQGWKAWDVVIEGISYVKSFREDFGAEIEQRGLDAVIRRLEQGGTPKALQKQSQGRS